MQQTFETFPIHQAHVCYVAGSEVMTSPQNPGGISNVPFFFSFLSEIFQTEPRLSFIFFALTLEIGLNLN